MFFLDRHENEAKALGLRLIAGVDEAGRGPLAGPVVVAACILPDGFIPEGLNDSKQLSEKKREELYAAITNNLAVDFAIAIVEATEIDQINILAATLEGMRLAVSSLKQMPDLVLVDGNRLPVLPMAAKALVKGDTLSASIAAASIIAKVTRDRLMQEYHQKYPDWNFSVHKGYGTKDHLERLHRFGASPIHRKTFAPVRKVLEKVCEAVVIPN